MLGNQDPRDLLQRQVPVNYTKTIQVPCGHWETEEYCSSWSDAYRKCVREPGSWTYDPCTCRCCYCPGKCHIECVQCPPRKCCKKLWVPSAATKEICCTKWVCEPRTKTCCYKVCHMVPERTTCCYKVCKMVPEQRTRTCCYKVCKMVPEAADLLLQGLQDGAGTADLLLQGLQDGS